MEAYFGSMQIVRILFQRSLAGLYLIAFIVALNQFPALVGEKGLLPVPAFINQVPFKSTPSIFYLYYSDRFFMFAAWLGILLSFITLFGLSEGRGWWLSAAVWLTLWVLYLSIINVGQTFYSFGWESMLCEAGFFAVFLGPTKLQAALIPIIILRWMLFRTELGAGLIKIRGDQCWRDLTCLFYHFETQPMPNPLSWFFYHLPKTLLKIGVLFSHFVQIIAPFGLFGPQRIAAAAGGLIILHQLMLIVSGNYSWLNWLTVALGLTAFSDTLFLHFVPVSLPAATRSPFYNGILYVLAALVIILSVPPTLNFFSRNQLMNYSYNPLHIVDSYGAFGTITKKRYEIIIEGTNDAVLDSQTQWKEYEFKGKPGDIRRAPPQVAPYHLRLDWLMWFLPFSVEVTQEGIITGGYELWFMRFVEKLLAADKPTIRLLKSSPFKDKPPHFIRARYYLYQFTDAQEKNRTGAWWKRRLIGDYLPPVTLSDLKNIAYP